MVNLKPAAESLALARSARFWYLALMLDAICLWSSKPLSAASWMKTGYVVYGDLVEFSYVVDKHFVGDQVADAPARHGEGFLKTHLKGCVCIRRRSQGCF